MMADSAFARAFRVVVGEEGGYTTNPADPGNWTSGQCGAGRCAGTKFGISAAAYPGLDIAGLSLGDAQAIYRRDYWDRVQGDALPPPLALLVNSASQFEYDRIDDFTAAGFDAHMAVNLRAPALITRAFAAAIPESDEAALVVNLLDAKLESLNPDFFTYTLAKIGLAGLTELTARAYAPRLRCAGIAPAVTLVSGPQSRENFEAVHAMNPLRRGVAVDEIVAALRFIIATPTFNAQTITLDGGQRLMGLRRDVAYMVEK